MSDDLISRQAAIDTIENTDWYHLNAKGEMVSGANSAGHQAWYKADDIYKVLEELPSAQPERKKGKWKIKTINTFGLAYGSTGYEPVYECSVCGAVEESYLRLDEPIMPEDADFPNYCPNCGADMRERREDDDRNG